MQLTKKQLEFYTAILVLCIIFAVAITLVDYGIKASILEQSNRLRLEIEEFEVRISGRKPAGTDEVRATNNSDNHSPISSDVLLDNTSGMEAGNGRAGDTAKARNTATNRAKPGRPTRNRTIPDGDK